MRFLCYSSHYANEVLIVKILAAAAEKREREAREKADKHKQAKEEAERLAAEKKKKKPIRYPTEDLDVRMADRDKKAGMKVKRPVANRHALPFNDHPGAFESFLMAWNFLVVYGLVPFIFNLFTFACLHFITVNHFIFPRSLLTNLNMPSVIHTQILIAIFWPKYTRP